MHSSNSSKPTPTPLPTPDLALCARGVDVYYGTIKVLEDVSLDVYPGKVTAIIGPSGCGKSTFIKALNRIGELESNMRIKGEIQFFGQNIYSQRVNLNRLRRQIGMVFQKPNPFPMSIYDNVAYGVRVFSRPSRSVLDELVESALTDAALWNEVKDSLTKSALSLSGGQQQRLCIARSLAIKPRVLLMDEPCSALDPIATLKIEELIRSLQQELTIVIVTHNMQQAARISDRTAFFSTDESQVGRLIETDATAKIFGAASHSRTRDYIEGRFG
ncbi:phosphate ABC transporter ATP-binding protein PstB [Myxacorys almedinensis]|uniref:Phosphate ABC transporter ATP-binding protein n=1 Tax=Myxacorys almedinensis A TaxID=2690445 RepID=A0A8J8CHA6_9CYAN|nr:phosphate ABC transporter ATP-binding protein [Myxacorys almedinensis A]